MTVAFRAVAGLASWAAMASFGHFLLALAGIANLPSALAIDALVAAISIHWWRRAEFGRPASEDRTGIAWILAAALAICTLIVLPALWQLQSVLPHGEWDAWSIWNLRARFIHGGAWRVAVSGDLHINHPEYPAFLSTLVAHLWTAAGSRGTLAPQLVSLGSLGVVGVVLVSVLALLRGRLFALAGGLVLAASAGYLSHTIVQYSDLPLSAFILLAAACLALARPIEAGFFASCAAWTKNEGIVFALLLCAGAWFLPQARRVWIGAAPGLAWVAFYKFQIAAQAGMGSNPANLMDGPRYLVIASKFLEEFTALGFTWRHPALATLLLMLVVGLRLCRPAIVIGGILAAQMLVYVGVYAATSHNLDWLLGTSAGRLLAQLWPSALFAIFLSLGELPRAAPVEQESAKESRKPKLAGKR